MLNWCRRFVCLILYKTSYGSQERKKKCGSEIGGKADVVFDMSYRKVSVKGG